MNTHLLTKTALFAIFLSVVISCSSPEDEPNPCTNGPELTAVSTIATTTGNATGSVTVAATSGESPYQYSLGGGAAQASPIFNNLAAATYTISVTDANNCMDQIEVIIKSVAEVSFASQVKPVIDTNCQKSGCHGSNVSLPSFATYTDVKANASKIKFRTSAKTMPPSGPLADGNIQLIADWVDQGAPNN